LVGEDRIRGGFEGGVVQRGIGKCTIWGLELKIDHGGPRKVTEYGPCISCKSCPKNSDSSIPFLSISVNLIGSCLVPGKERRKIERDARRLMVAVEEGA